MSHTDNIALLAQFPGSLAALLQDRLLHVDLNLEEREIAIGAFVQDVVEDVFFVRDGVLTATDRETYTIRWIDGKWVCQG